MFRATNWCLVAKICVGVGYRLEIGVGVAIDLGRRCLSVLVLMF